MLENWQAFASLTSFRIVINLSTISNHHKIAAHSSPRTLSTIIPNASLVDYHSLILIKEERRLICMNCRKSYSLGGISAELFVASD
jgi:hypothetical protein